MQNLPLLLDTSPSKSLLGLLPYSLGGAARNVECSAEEGPPLCGHEWCDDQAAISEAQFFVSFFVGFFGYPYCVAISQAIYSKAIGPRPQVRAKQVPKLKCAY